MKFLKKLLLSILVIAFLFGCTSTASDGTTVLHGTVQQTVDNEYIMTSEGTQYILKGQDFSTMKGHMATVKGKVTNDGGKEILTASSAEIQN
jgi:outer membrane biogenesis lipoprotein LolB